MDIEEKNKRFINPQKTPLYMDVNEIKDMRGLIALGVLKKVNANKLLDTIQYLHEVIERMEEHDDYVSCILTKEQTNQIMRDLYGWTDEDIDKSNKESLKLLEKIKKSFNKK